MKNPFVVPIAIVAAGIIIGGAVYVSMKGSTAPSALGNPSAVTPITSADHIFGNPRAKVMLVTYSDFDCPYCKTYDAIVRQTVSEYGTTGDVAWVFRNFPLTELHENAKRHAEAAECAAKTADSEAYWRFAALLFENQPALPIKYAEYARVAGASPEEVAACIQDASANGVSARIDAERQNALLIGARGTPYSLIVVAGKAPVVIDGATSYAALKEILEAALLEVR